jgi:hypothetical protein
MIRPKVGKSVSREDEKKKGVRRWELGVRKKPEGKWF